MSTTSRLGLPYPGSSSPANVPGDIHSLANTVDGSVAGYITTGTGGTTPSAASHVGFIWWCSDTANTTNFGLNYSDGSIWHNIGTDFSVSSTAPTGRAINQLYFNTSTFTLSYWDGTAWTPLLLNASSIGGFAVSSTSPSTNQALVWGGSSWGPAKLPTAGIATGALPSGVTLPATQLTTGAIPSGVTLPATQVSTGALPSGVTLPATQVSTGALPSGVTLPATQVSTGALSSGVTLPATQLTSGVLPSGVTIPASQVTNLPASANVAYAPGSAVSVSNTANNTPQLNAVVNPSGTFAKYALTIHATVIDQPSGNTEVHAFLLYRVAGSGGTWLQGSDVALGSAGTTTPTYSRLGGTAVWPTAVSGTDYEFQLAVYCTNSRTGLTLTQFNLLVVGTN